MKIQIESASNGYIITIPPEDDDGIDRKIVIQENESEDESLEEFGVFDSLVSQLQDIFGVYNSKHNKIGYVSGLCSEHIRWEILLYQLNIQIKRRQRKSEIW